MGLGSRYARNCPPSRTSRRTALSGGFICPEGAQASGALRQVSSRTRAPRSCVRKDTWANGPDAWAPSGQMKPPESALLPEGAKVADAWGRWLLFPTLPDREAIAARALKVSPDPNLRQMEVWALAP